MDGDINRYVTMLHLTILKNCVYWHLKCYLLDVTNVCTILYLHSKIYIRSLWLTYTHWTVLSGSVVCDSLPGASVHVDSPGKNTGVGCWVLLQEIFPTQGSNPGLPHCRQILYQLSHQGSPRILEWVAYPFSRASSLTRNQMGSPA